MDRYYTTTGRSFQQNVSGRPASGTLAANAAQDGVVSIGRDGTVRREGGLLAANSSEQGAEDLSMYKTDLTFDRIDLQNQAMDLGIEAIQWDNNGEAMVTLVVTNWAHLGSGSRDANIQIMEAYLDDEKEPCFRYNLQAEVSDKETWNFDVPLSMLTDNRRAGKVTVKIKGKNYKEVGDVDNSVEILLDAETLSVRTQPESQDVPAGGEAVFHSEPAGGRAPYRYQWQVKKPGGQWTDLEGETTDTLRVSGVTAEESGTQYRLVITDASDYTVTTYAATLTVKQVPPTGDSVPLVWYALGIFAAIGVLACIALKKKKENEA